MRPRFNLIRGARRHKWVWPAGAVGLAGAVLFLSSCARLTESVLAPPQIAGAHYVGNKTCAECHAPIARSFPASPHARFFKDNPGPDQSSGCESCHGPGSKHVQAGGGRGVFIVNPGKDPASCFGCHLDVQADFQLPHHHPLPEMRLNCVACHEPHGMDIYKRGRGLAMARLNETCANCHRQQTKPVVFEHPALREGCTVCHQPHGSVNRKLLADPDPNLCLRCHAQIQGPDVGPGNLFIGKSSHTAYLQQGTCWSAGCHTAVHGSNVSGMFFY